MMTMMEEKFDISFIKKITEEMVYFRANDDLISER